VGPAGAADRAARDDCAVTSQGARRRVLRDAAAPPQRRLRPPRAARTRRAPRNHPGSRHRRPTSSTWAPTIASSEFALCCVASGALWCRKCYDPASTSRVRRHRASPSSPPSSLCLTRCWTSSWADQRALVGASYQSLLPSPSACCPCSPWGRKLDRTMELTGPLIVDHPLAALVIFASESYNPSLIVNQLCDHTSLALRAPCAWADL
jgi:hypothetical protein